MTSPFSKTNALFFLLALLTALPANAQYEPRLLTYDFVEGVGQFGEDCLDELPPAQPVGIIATPLTKAGVGCHADDIHRSRLWSTNDTLDVEKYLAFTVYPEDNGTLLFTPQDSLQFIGGDFDGSMEIAVRFAIDSTFHLLDMPRPLTDSTNIGDNTADTLSFGFQNMVTADSITFHIHAYKAENENESVAILKLNLSFQVNIPVSVEGKTHPNTSTLSSFYPNPFRNHASLPLTLSEPAQVRLTMYNLLGKEVETVIDTWLPAGTHEPTWNPHGLPNGLYLYRLQVNDQVQAGSVTLLR